MRNRKNGLLRLILVAVFTVAGFVGAAYVGAWLMFVKPIMDAYAAFKAGAITYAIICITVTKCVFAGSVSSLFIACGCAVGKYFLNK
jgi:zinc transporter ZupT